MEDNKQNNNQPIKSNEEEIDLGQLFSLIGNGISGLYHFIGEIINKIFHGVLSIILFIKRHVLKLVIGTIVGYSGGYIYKTYFTVTTYESSMTVQPNFGSTMQLYKNIEFYQNLVTLKDTVRLASSLNISAKEASNITKFEVEPYKNGNQTLLAFKNFSDGLLDSITRNRIDFDDFIENQSSESFKFHLVNVVSKDRYIFGKLRSPVISSIIRNAYYDKVRETSYLNLLSSKKALKNSMQELDTLRNFYKEIMISESKKTTSGTNIYMSSTEGNDKEIVVFDKYMKMNQQLIGVNKKLTEETDVITVISTFNPVGKKVTGWKKKYSLLGGLLGFSITFIVFGLALINRELIAYENSNKI